MKACSLRDRTPGHVELNVPLTRQQQLRPAKCGLSRNSAVFRVQNLVTKIKTSECNHKQKFGHKIC